MGCLIIHEPIAPENVPRTSCFADLRSEGLKVNRTTCRLVNFHAVYLQKNL